MEKAIIELRGVSKKYGNTTACDNINMLVHQGEFLCVLGKSGSGKSTLLSLIAGYIEPNSGEVIVSGENIGSYNEDDKANYRRNKIGVVFQFFNLISELNVYENIVLPFHLAHRKINHHYVERVMKILDIANLRNKKTYECSGGQQQRIAIARAIIMCPDIVLADEPTGNLDSQNSENVIKLLKEIQKEFGLTFVIVTHDLHVAQMGTRIIEMKDGKIVRDSK